jgi:hypothetical protein
MAFEVFLKLLPHAIDDMANKRYEKFIYICASGGVEVSIKSMKKCETKNTKPLSELLTACSRWLNNHNVVDLLGREDDEDELMRIYCQLTLTRLQNIFSVGGTRSWSDLAVET